MCIHLGPPSPGLSWSTETPDRPILCQPPLPQTTERGKGDSIPSIPILYLYLYDDCRSPQPLTAMPDGKSSLAGFVDPPRDRQDRTGQDRPAIPKNKRFHLQVNHPLSSSSKLACSRRVVLPAMMDGPVAIYRWVGRIHAVKMMNAVRLMTRGEKVLSHPHQGKKSQCSSTTFDVPLCFLSETMCGSRLSSRDQKANNNYSILDIMSSQRPSNPP